MSFRTKLDYSDNRQIKQRERTFTDLIGGTVFGLPFSGLTSGVDTSNTGTTEENINITGNTFSGNATTTIFTWSDSRMSLADSSLSAITPSNSATTQDSGNIFTVNDTTIIDGNTVILSYSGVSLEDIVVTTMEEVTPGNYTGTTEVDTFSVLSGGSLDYTGRTIWVDCEEIARTKKLIITENPTPGNVWTCTDSEGLGAWLPSSGAVDTNTFITGATFDKNTLNITRNDAIIVSAEWTGNTLDSCIADFHVTNIHSCSPLFINPLDEGDIYVGSNSGFTFDLASTRFGVNSNEPTHTLDVRADNGNSRIFYEDAHVDTQSLLLSGDTNQLTQVGVVSPVSVGAGFTSLTVGVRGETGDYPVYGAVGDAVLYAGNGSNGLNIICQQGGVDKYIRMYAGTDADAEPNPDFIILGTGNRGYVGVGMNTPTEMFDVADNARIRNIGSGASAGALHYTSSGVLTTNTSDLRMKEDINTITGALEKVQNLRGVTYKWKEENSTGDTRIGFIAQEVEGVVPELAFVNERTEDKLMGVHYQDVTALLVEAVKELSTSGSTLFNREEVIINSQTVASEDNNIELNYNGTKESALGGGIFVNKGIDTETNSELLINSDGDWVTNNYIKAFGLVLPNYTPTSTNDTKGELNEVVADDDHIYVKTTNGWKRTGLETF